MNSIFVIIVNYNNFADTEECIDSLFNMNQNNYKIIVVDNASQDGSPEKIKSKYKDKIVLIENKHNMGFGIANNIGAKYAIRNGATHVLILNNDTIVEPNFLDNLLTKSTNETICVPKILSYYEKDIIWYAGGKIDKIRGTSLHFGKGKKESNKYSKEKEVDYLTGCCALIPTAIIINIGLFGDEFFLYFEDMDFSIRCLLSDIKIKYIPDAIIYHKEGASSGGKKSKIPVYYANRNRFYLLRKYNRLFGVSSHIYTYISRLIYYIFGVIRDNDNRYIKQAYLDYKNGIMGEKLEL